MTAYVTLLTICDAAAQQNENETVKAIHSLCSMLPASCQPVQKFKRYESVLKCVDHLAEFPTAMFRQ